jgi:hypothetical protein
MKSHDNANTCEVVLQGRDTLLVKQVLRKKTFKKCECEPATNLCLDL